MYLGIPARRTIISPSTDTSVAITSPTSRAATTRPCPVRHKPLPVKMAHPSDDPFVPASSVLPMVRPKCQCPSQRATFFVLAPELWRMLVTVGYESTGSVGTYYCKRCRISVDILWSQVSGPLARHTSMH